MSDDDNMSSVSSTKSNFSDSSTNLLSLSDISSNKLIKLFSILGVGDPIVDILSEISTDIIEKYGMKLGDSIFASEDCDEPNLEMFKILESMPMVNYIPGGSVQNTMRVISWRLNNDDDIIPRKYFKVSMLGSVGDDLYKNKIIQALEDIGVNPILEILKDDKTSRCGVGVYKKEKLFVTQLRASKRLSEKFINDNLEKILEHDALIIEGYLLKNKFELIKKLCEHFEQNNKMIVLTLSATFIVKSHFDKLIELGNKSEIIAGNMEEAKEFAGIDGNNEKEIFRGIFKKLKPKENRLLLVTDGQNGALCGKYNYENNQLEFIIQCFAPKINDKEIKDLNGAGDAFLGGFLSEYMKGNEIYDCCKNGINAATIILKNVGCTFPKKVKFQQCKEFISK